MSRSKRRKAQKQKKEDKQSLLIIRGAVVVVALVIVAVLFLQFGQDEQVVLSEDGRPIWQTMELRDVRTGETFTLADFDDRNVFVKIMSPF